MRCAIIVADACCRRYRGYRLSVRVVVAPCFVFLIDAGFAQLERRRIASEKFNGGENKRSHEISIFYIHNIQLCGTRVYLFVCSVVPVAEKEKNSSQPARVNKTKIRDIADDQHRSIDRPRFASNRKDAFRERKKTRQTDRACLCAQHQHHPSSSSSIITAVDQRNFLRIARLRSHRTFERKRAYSIRIRIRAAHCAAATQNLRE